MSIIATNVSSFEEIVSRHIKNVKEFGLKDLSNWLERLDVSLYSDRPKHLKIIKIQSRTILTTIGLLSFKRRYYYDEINDRYMALMQITCICRNHKLKNCSISNIRLNSHYTRFSM